MGSKEIYDILKDIVQGLARVDDSFKSLPETYAPEMTFEAAGLDLATLPEVFAEFEARFNGKDLALEGLLAPEALNTSTLGNLVERVRTGLAPIQTRDPIVVYVDDEEENLFVFKRKFGKRLNLKAFTEPLKALEFIKSEDKVRLVITDEVMPRMNGNELCDAVHMTKPTMKFILITGNPNNEGDLMYKALRKNRFFEFISKPVDFEAKGDEYMAMIQGLIDFDW